MSRIETVFEFICDIAARAMIFAAPLLKNLDASLLQNIILGILAIFIPFAIVFLTDVMRSKNERTEFEKMVLSAEVLGARKIFWLSVLGIGALAFFSGKDIGNWQKLLAFLIAIAVVAGLGSAFRRALRFSEGYKSEFETSFLKGLNLVRVFRFRNKLKCERMERAWTSFWSQPSAYFERPYAQIFARHIDDALRARRYSLAISLAKTYESNIEKRDILSLGHDILPHLLPWDEKLWTAERNWLARSDRHERISSHPLLSRVPVLKGLSASTFGKIYPKDYTFWEYQYFYLNMLPSVTKALLSNGHGPYQLLTYFKKYITTAERRIAEIEDEDERIRRRRHLVNVVGSFCVAFFNHVDQAPAKFDIWEHYFPSEWKVTGENSEQLVSRVILEKFLKWAYDRILGHSANDYDNELTEVASGIFPGVHTEYFRYFLLLYLTGDSKLAITKNLNFIITSAPLYWIEN